MGRPPRNRDASTFGAGDAEMSLSLSRARRPSVSGGKPSPAPARFFCRRARAWWPNTFPGILDAPWREVSGRSFHARAPNFRSGFNGSHDTAAAGARSERTLAERSSLIPALFLTACFRRPPVSTNIQDGNVRTLRARVIHLKEDSSGKQRSSTKSAESSGAMPLQAQP